MHEQSPCSSSSPAIHSHPVGLVQCPTSQQQVLRSTFVIVLSILLLIISVSGFFVLIISNDSNLMHPHHQQRADDPSTSAYLDPGNFIFYASTLFQLALIIVEVAFALVIVFLSESQHEIDSGTKRSNSAPISSVNAVNYYQVPSTSRDADRFLACNLLSQHEQPKPLVLSRAYTNKNRLILALKIIFVLLVCVSFVARFVSSSWGSIFWSSVYSYQDSGGGSGESRGTNVVSLVQTLVTGNSYFNGVIYATTLFEMLMFLLVLTSSASA